MYTIQNESYMGDSHQERESPLIVLDLILFIITTRKVTENMFQHIYENRISIVMITHDRGNRSAQLWSISERYLKDRALFGKVVGSN
jgi:hypothetical protein